MKPIPEGYELADEPQPLAARYPGVAMTLLGVAISGAMVVFGTWIDERQRPHLEKITAAIGKLSEENRQLATFQLETSRYIGLALSGISESANVKMPERPKELDRAEGRVRDIQERVN